MTLYLVGGGYTANAVRRLAGADERFREVVVVRRRAVDLGDRVVPDFAEFPNIFGPQDAVVLTFPATDDGRAEAAVAAACTEIPTVYVSRPLSVKAEPVPGEANPAADVAFPDRVERML